MRTRAIVFNAGVAAVAFLASRACAWAGEVATIPGIWMVAASAISGGLGVVCGVIALACIGDRLAEKDK